MQTVFITGSTGYIGTRLIKVLLKAGNFHVQALVRKGSEHKLPQGCEIIIGDALDAASYQHKIAPPSTFVHLIGVAHPSPAKKEQFKKIDLVSIKEAVKAATHADVIHFIYLSVYVSNKNYERLSEGSCRRRKDVVADCLKNVLHSSMVCIGTGALVAHSFKAFSIYSKAHSR